MKIFKTVLKGTAAVISPVIRRINVRVGAFSSVAAVLLWAVASPIVFPPNTVTMSTANMMVFTDAFDRNTSETAKNLINRANNNVTEGERILITLTSPGGEVFTGKLFQDAIRTSKVPVDMHVTALAASMGADTLMLGSRRYVAPDALVVFHGAFAGSYADGENMKKELLDLLESKEMAEYVATGVNPEKDPAKLARMNTLYKEILQSGYSAVYIEVKSAYNMVKKVNDLAINRMAGHIKWEPEKVRHVLFKDMKEDAIFTGRELLEMGIIDGFDPPSLDPYKGD